MQYSICVVPPREKIAKEVKLSKLSFTVDKLIVTPVIPDPAGWKHVLEIPFG